jgi:hydroxypyruvate isomerase
MEGTLTASSTFDFAANVSLLFRERPLLERFDAARAAGFTAVELQFPYAVHARELSAAARSAGVDVVLINAPVTQEHRLGIAGRHDLRAQFMSHLDRAVEYAQALGVRYVNVLAGEAGDRPHAECRDVLVESLLFAADRLAVVGADVLLEPLNRHDMPGYLVDDFSLGSSIIDACAGRVGLQFDVYHSARMGLEPLAALTAALSRVRHVQFADAPGRHEPGTGRLRFEPLWELLREARYTGHVAAEYHPADDTRSSLGWLECWRDPTARR